jgi:predicted transcriptional regulator
MKKQKTLSPDEKAYLAAIDEALAEADKGIFVSGEAVIEWLESWGTDNVKPSPEPDIFPRKRRSA